LPARGLVFVGVVEGGELDFLVLELLLGAVDGGFEGRGSLVAEGLVDLVACVFFVVVIVGRLGDRGEFEGQ
jgi:hypothetical protein